MFKAFQLAQAQSEKKDNKSLHEIAKYLADIKQSQNEISLFKALQQLRCHLHNTDEINTLFCSHNTTEKLVPALKEITISENTQFLC